jgi:hypothetical protein
MILNKKAKCQNGFMATIHSRKIDLRIKNITIGHFLMGDGAFNHKAMPVINMYLSKNRAPKFMRQKKNLTADRKS